MLENAAEWAQWVVDWFNGKDGGGIIGLAQEYAAYMIKEAIIGWLKLKLFIAKFAWGIAQELLTDLGVDGILASAWGVLDVTTRELLAFFRIPEGVTLILNASVTKMILRMVGW